MRGATPRQRPREKRRVTRQSASRVQSLPRLSPRIYFRDHLRVLMASLGRLYRNPVNNLMTAMVVGIALALPGALLVALDNLQRVTGGWEGSPRISVYLRTSVKDPAPLRTELNGWPEIETVDVISSDQALEEFRRLSGFGDALDSLKENPLPNVLVLTPSASHSSPEAGEVLLQRLQKLPQVDLAQLDLEWLKRLAAMMELGRQIVLAIGALLGVGVLLIVGNTIRLEIENRREEIEVTKLVGGTDGFIRRPFLYMGCWHGLIGALIAWALVNLATWQLSEPVQRLAGLYAGSFQLHAAGIRGGMLLLLTGTGLGLVGSWLAVGRHLDAIEPV
ncbi:MAG: permease-like cell division protein FtsX [Gammaproteobacteria bacterium]